MSLRPISIRASLVRRDIHVVAALYPAKAVSQSGSQSGNASTNTTSNQSSQAPTGLKSGVFNGLLANGTITFTDLVGPLENKTIGDLVNITKRGNAYVNVHTEQKPAGEVRGQFDLVNMSCSAGNLSRGSS